MQMNVHMEIWEVLQKDILIIISNSGNTEELKPVIQYANRYKVKLIGITSIKDSLLYKASDIKLLIPKVKEAALNVVPQVVQLNKLLLEIVWL